MVKVLILLSLLLLGLVWGWLPDESSLQITIVIPAGWGLYFEWLLDFPGWRQGQGPGPGNIQSIEQIASGSCAAILGKINDNLCAMAAIFPGR